MTPRQFRIGCAGWTIPKQHAPFFPPRGSHLERYALRLTAVEINSSFRQPHRRATYERWAGAVPQGFAFSVKAPKMITHELRLHGADATLDEFLAQVTGLGNTLGPLLFQLPPSLEFDPQIAASFFAALRTRFDGSVVCEPRHKDWFALRADDLLKEFRIARAAADPPVVAAAAGPGGWSGLHYFRQHGSPQVYYSDYGPEQLERLAQRLAAAQDDCPAWCIFDNTAAGAALVNALALQERVRQL
jgi:uncharacterized protein YecE (DUF72 family)